MSELSEEQRKDARVTYEVRARMEDDPRALVIKVSEEVVELEKAQKATLEVGKAMRTEIDRRMADGDQLMADALEVSMSEIRKAMDEALTEVAVKREVLRHALEALAVQGEAS